MVSVPTPTIVLAVMTCIPFGLAIRDTVTGKYDLPPDDERDSLEDLGESREYEEEDYREVAARREAEESEHRAAIAEFEARQESDRAWRAELVKSLYGAELASLGSAFESITLGGAIGEGAVESSPDIDLMLLDDGLATHTLYIKIQDSADTMCSTLGRELPAAWGAPRRLTGRSIWINNHTQTRAVFDPRTCELRYEKLTDLASWLSKSEDSLVPLWAVGKPAQKLIDALGARTSSTIEDEQITWSVRGLGAGLGPTQMIADVKQRKIVSIVASVQTDPTTQDQVIGHVSQLTGKQPDDQGVWKSTPGIAVETGGAQMFVKLGAP
jgi:hypothetical protein